MNPISRVVQSESFTAKMALSVMPNGIENERFTEKHLNLMVAPVLCR